MTQASTIKVERISSKIRKVIFANAPVNLIVPETVTCLHEVVKELSNDEEVQVVIFSSSVSDYFYNHFDLSQIARFPNAVDADGNTIEATGEAGNRKVKTDGAKTQEELADEGRKALVDN